MGIFDFGGFSPSRKEHNRCTVEQTVPYNIDMVVQAINMGVGYHIDKFDQRNNVYKLSSMMMDEITIQLYAVAFNSTQIVISSADNIGAASLGGLNMETFGNKRHATKVLNKIVENLSRI